MTGDVEARHRPLAPADDPAHRNGAPAPRPPEPEALARLTPPPLAEDLAQINKVSQNLHAELMLRRLGLHRRHPARSRTASRRSRRCWSAPACRGPAGTCPTARACRPTTAWRRARVATLLRWAAAQPWGAAWRATFPIAGVDGTLARRFRGTPLEGRLFAKTGTLNATNALSGYMIARSGRTLIFSFYANDFPADASATEVMDRGAAR